MDLLDYIRSFNREAPQFPMDMPSVYFLGFLDLKEVKVKMI